MALTFRFLALFQCYQKTCLCLIVNSFFSVRVCAFSSIQKITKSSIDVGKAQKALHCSNPLFTLVSHMSKLNSTEKKTEELFEMIKDLKAVALHR